MCVRRYQQQFYCPHLSPPHSQVPASQPGHFMGSNGRSPSLPPTSFGVNQIQNPEFDENLHRNGLQALVHAYAKYGVELTPEIKKAVRMNPSVTEISLRKRSGNMTGTAPAVPPNGFDWEFISPVQIGTPSQTVYLDLNTGSADLWVFSADTPLEQSIGHDIYDSSSPTSRTFIENIKDDLVSPVFTANLKHSIEGNYNFGYLNAATDEGIAYAPIDPKSVYWTFLATGYGVGPPLDDFEPTTKTAIADTGTTLLLLPSQIVRAYYARVTGSVYDPYWAAMIFPCEAELPDFSFYIGPGGSTYRGVVPGRYMNYVSFNGSHCYGGIQSSDAIGFAIFGALLIKSQFVVFDVGQKGIGFAGKELAT
ncbi:Aspartic peptidase domain containing protein [Rhypophila sp. PSN 637]